ncbi:pilus assembly protein, partial [Salmonella enterica subsp. enterica serovar Typhimurium]|nr:pilus assembly protein [Salmonella enterica subsp. enterica serovar Typhimurium]
YDIPVSTAGNVYWKVITDYGGYSKQFEAKPKS